MAGAGEQAAALGALPAPCERVAEAEVDECRVDSGREVVGARPVCGAVGPNGVVGASLAVEGLPDAEVRRHRKRLEALREAVPGGGVAPGGEVHVGLPTGRGGGTSRIFGEVSYSTFASSTPALPSTPEWWALV